jgi:predicted phage-related endonuclease
MPVAVSDVTTHRQYAGNQVIAMQLLLTQDEIDDDPRRWHELRQTGIGASEIPTVIRAEGAFSSPFALFWRKIDGSGIPDTLSMRRGRHDESLVAELLDEHPSTAGVSVIAGGMYRSDERDWQFATFDRLGVWAGHGLVPIQIKTSNTRKGWGDAPDGDVPAHILAQVIDEIDVADAGEALLPVLFDGPDELRVYRIIRDDDAERDIRYMRDSGAQFWQRILDRDPPDVDWHADTTAALKRIHARVEHKNVPITRALARRLRRAYAAKRAAEQRFDLVSNLVRDQMGDGDAVITRGRRGIDDAHPFGLDYDVIATRSVYPETRVDVKALRAAVPAVAGEFSRTKQVDKLLVKQPKIFPGQER